MVDLADSVKDMQAEGVARMFYYLASGLVIVYLSRQLVPAEYGRLFLALSILTVCRLFSSIGLAKSAAKHVSYYREEDPGQVRHVLLKSLKYNAVSIAVVAGFILVAAEAIARALGEPSIETLLVVGTLYIISATLYNYARVLLQGFQDIFQSATVYASEGIGRLVGVVVLVTLGYGIMGALLGYITGFVIAAVLGLTLLYVRLPAKSSTGPMADGLVRRILRYSLPLSVTRSAWVLDREVDIILVGYFLNPATVSFYAISKQIVTFCTGPAGSIGFSIGPKFNEATVAKSKERARAAYEKVLVFVLLFYVPAIAGLVILADPLVTTVFGNQYQDVVPILRVFALAILIRAITETTEDILDYIGRADTRAKFKLGTSAGNAVLTVVLIQFLDAIGAALATVGMQAIYAGLCLSVIQTEIGLRNRHLLGRFGRILVITAVMSTVVASLTAYIDGLVTIVLVILCGSAVWAVLAVKGGFLPLDVILKQVPFTED